MNAITVYFKMLPTVMKNPGNCPYQNPFNFNYSVAHKPWNCKVSLLPVFRTSIAA
jgi:hypothetical protein